MARRGVACRRRLVVRSSHHAPQPQTIPKALAESSGTRHAAAASSPPRMLALVPSAASPSGMTQHDEATTAPRPAASPKAANHFGAAAASGGEASLGGTPFFWSEYWRALSIGFGFCSSTTNDGDLKQLIARSLLRHYASGKEGVVEEENLIRIGEFAVPFSVVGAA